MRPASTLLALAVAALAAAGCQPQTTVSGDLRDAGRSLGHAAAGVRRDQNLRQAEADLHQAGHDASRDLRRAEAEMRDAARRISADAHRVMHDLSHHNAPDRSGD